MPRKNVAEDTPLIKQALAVAKRYPVFPTVGKKPAWSNKELGVGKGEGGYKVATQDPAEVRRLFAHRNATEIAVPMGELSGLMCIDVDRYKAQKDGPAAALELDEWLDRADWLEETLCHTTRSSGLHYFFKHPGNDIRFPATLRKYIDIKASGNGYVCWPPTTGYEVALSLDPDDFPITVLEQALKDKGGTGSISAPSGFNSDTDDELIERIQRADDLYPALRTLSMRLVTSRTHRMPEAEQIVTLERIMDSSDAAEPGHPRHEDWIDRREKIPGLIDSARDKEEEVRLTPSDIELLMTGEAFLDTQKILAAAVRPIGPQRGPSLADIEARVAEIQGEDDDEYVTVDVQGLRKEIIPPVEWLIPGIIPKRNSVGLAGASNVGKTRWLASLAVCVAAGKTERMGLPRIPEAEARSVLWIANEEYVDDIKRRMKAYALHYSITSSAPVIVRGKEKGAFKLARVNDMRMLEVDVEGVAGLVAAIRKTGAVLVIMDPYVTLVDAIEGAENSSAAAEITRAALTDVQTLTGATTLFAHHTPKGDSAAKGDWYRGSLEALRGSGAIGGALDVCLTLAQWWPRVPETRKAWGNNLLTKNLKRWVVIDSAKVREGDAVQPLIYELVGQGMADGEGRDIGVCHLSSSYEAEASLTDAVVDGLRTSMLAALIVDELGEGTHPNLSTLHNKLKHHDIWLGQGDRLGPRQVEELTEMFEHDVRVGDTTAVRIEADPTAKKNSPNRWRVVITEEE